MDSCLWVIHPCPNDTVIFYALVHGCLDEAPAVREVLEDIETLNSMALNGQLDATKISFHALAHMRDTTTVCCTPEARWVAAAVRSLWREEIVPDALPVSASPFPAR